MRKEVKTNNNNAKVKREKVIDLASTVAAEERAISVYLCPECNNDLILDSSYRLRNPLVGGTGEGYWCGSCGKDFYTAFVTLHKKPKAVSSIIGHSTTNNNSEIIFQSVREDKGLDLIEDEYAKYDPEENADQFLINSGATIIRSEITITDSSGRNRTIVKRDLDYSSQCDI